MADKSWQKGLSFSERLSAIMKMTSACKKAYPSLSSAENQAKARSIEERSYHGATSSDNYQELNEQAIRELLLLSRSAPTSPIETADDLSRNLPVEQIGPYRATHLESGLFSTIYRSVDPDTCKAIAIKLTTPHMMSPPHNSLREARLLKVAAHETIIPLLSSQKIAGGHFLLIFPFTPYDLSTLLQKKILHPVQTQSHLRSLFSALSHIHSLSLLHRDIKPSNILLASPNGPAYLADFGISWHADDPDSEPKDQKITDVGTTSYRAPELLFGWTEYDESLDLWAAGCVVAEALNSGKSLFDAGDLGSELALIRSIFTTMGTPNDEIWPEAKSFPDWGKIQFKEYLRREWDDVLRGVDKKGIDLVSRLVRYESGDRMRADQVLEHPYFTEKH